MKKIKALAIFNALSLLTHILFAILSQQNAFNDLNVGEVSAKYETLFTPAGITFSIWGIIYTFLSLMCLYHIVIAYKHDMNHPANEELLRINGLFIALNLASAAWLVAWTGDMIDFSLGLMILQIACLIFIHIRLGLYNPLKISGLKLVSQFPLSIYLGWLSIATIANFSSTLVAHQWNGFGIPAERWMLIMIAVAVLLSLFMIFVRRNIYFGLVVCWALYGIILKRESSAGDFSNIVQVCWIGKGFIGVCCLIQLVRNITYKKPAPLFPSPPLPIK